jgi:Ran-binding protein 9/10
VIQSYITVGTGFGSKYGESFTTNNIVGCLYEITTGSVSFVRQGQRLESHVVHEAVTVPMFAVCGTHSQGEHVKINFGAEPFEFDVASYPADSDILFHI